MRNAESKSSHIALFARFGFGARGLVYLVIGGLALAAVLGRAGDPEGFKGALKTLLSQPLGNVMLGLVVVGLLGYALWRALQATFDTGGHGSDAKGIAVRIGLFASALVHAGLALWAIGLLLGWGADSGGLQGLTADLMRQPMGRWLVAALGGAIGVAGLAHIWSGAVGHFERHMDWNAQTARWAKPVCMLGLIARGVAFVLIGAFVALAAVRASPRHAGGLEQALESLQQQPYGPWLLGAMAVGLLAYAIYSVIEAVYRRMRLPGESSAAKA